MSSKLRSILTALCRPLRWLRIHPGLFAGVLGLIALVTVIAMLVHPTAGPATIATAATPKRPVVETELSYSGLRDAMSAHTVKSACPQAGGVQG